MIRANIAILICVSCLVDLGSQPLLADELTLEISGQTYHLEGDILIEAQDKSLYFRENNGKIWFVQPGQIKEKSDVDTPAAPISKKELGKRLLAELPEGFRIYETRHYVIAYQNELAYARWVGGLYESRLYRGFEMFFKQRKKFDLEAPEFPLAAIIFGSRAQYQQYVDRELGPGQNMIAYYNVQTNRVTMYDLTAENRPPGQPLDDRRIEQVLQNPWAVPMVATIIHEGTHQLLFNRGVQTRFADCPLWVNEGLAMYFEAPNVRSKRGWQKPGMVFDQRLSRFRDYLSRRPGDSLRSLIANDDRLRNAETALDAYAEAWALNHFLLNRKSKEYINYLKRLSENRPLIELNESQRMAMFEEFLGNDLPSLDKEFLSYVERLR